MIKKLLIKISLFSLVLLYTSQSNAWSWTAMSTGTGADVYAMTAWNSTQIIAAGNFTTPGSRIALWNGSTWSALTGGGINDGIVNALAVYKGVLYAAGTFTSVGTPAITANHIAKWNGTTWSILGSGSTNGANSNVNALIVFGTSPNDTLFIGGIFNSCNGVSTVDAARWDGTTFTPAGLNGPGGFVYCFAIHNGSLYAGGTGNKVTKYLPGNLNFGTAVGSPTLSDYVETLCDYNGFLYAGGNFDLPGCHGIAYLNANTWTAVGTGYPVNTNAKAMIVYGTSPQYLITGGTFFSAGGITSRGIAIWNGSVWGVGYAGTAVNGDVHALASTSAPALYAGGTFTAPASRMMQVIGSIGIEELSIPSSSVKMYPNPAHGNLNLFIDADVKNPRVEIYNIIGAKIYSDALKNELQSISVKIFSPGIYFVKIISETGGSQRVLTQKLVIE